MDSLFDMYTASAVVNSGLGVNRFLIYDHPPLVKREQVLSFMLGQPLGYYASWAPFALSHHVIVWLAAERVCFSRSEGIQG